CPAQRLPFREALLPAADVRDLRRARRRRKLRATRFVDGRPPGAGADEQRVHGRAGEQIRGAPREGPRGRAGFAGGGGIPDRVRPTAIGGGEEQGARISLEELAAAALP